ncbi:nuclease-related domain-containing protein [Bacillus gobiensis]|uniref:nuclease-related domain-containing protein n=1 Tax=Bacillus gobiensis TaxID=1441095 RepID=UPI003D1F33E1
MIVKDRKIPRKILIFKALLRRLPSNHPSRKKIEEELLKSYAGYRGEQSIDYHLTFLPADKYHLLHDLRLQNRQKHYFQMDTLILSPHFFLILEVKNISGSLYFDQVFHQLIRTADGKEEGFPDPILQVKKQEKQLKYWLADNHYPSVPIVSLVVISNSSTIIRCSPNEKEMKEKVIHSNALPFKLEALEALHKTVKLSNKELKKISHRLYKNHQPIQPSILQQFQIAEKDILTGVHCPSCDRLPMKREEGKWKCDHCESSSNDAHLSSLDDYALLFSTEVTNQQIRRFLHMKSVKQSRSLLTSMNLHKTGMTKGRTYHLEPPQSF